MNFGTSGRWARVRTTQLASRNISLSFACFSGENVSFTGAGVVLGEDEVLLGACTPLEVVFVRPVSGFGLSRAHGLGVFL
jgi:hypothetical protein